jgi:hypothetical protein
MDEFTYLTGLKEEVKRLEGEMEHNRQEIKTLWKCLYAVMRETGAFPELEAVEEEELG